MTAFEKRFGFRRQDVSLGNWRQRPFSTWAFQNVGEIVPSAAIRSADGGREPSILESGSLLSQHVTIGGSHLTIKAFLEQTCTDAFVVMKHGRFICDFNAAHMAPSARHIVFSISKSLTAILAGSLEAEGVLDPDAPVVHYFPEASASAYGDCTLRHLLDMTVSLDFDESYLDAGGAFGRYRQATLWNPAAPEARPETLRQFLLTLGKSPAQHGKVLRYRSPNSDLLGIIVERVSGLRYTDLMSERLWVPLGAHHDASVTVDGEGTARAAGGISVTVHDLARVGEMMRSGGLVGDVQIVPERWVHDTLTSGDPAIWKAGDLAHLLNNGRYRNQWYQTGQDNGVFFALGIHGQWLYVDPSTATVMAKLSSQAEPVDDAMDLKCLVFFDAVSKIS